VQSEIDLHGHTIDEAHDALSDFIVEARQHGYRCVRAIHGKGLTSPNREPVLKGRVRRWLAHWDEVLAYCEAPPHAGGGGAVLILLRARTCATVAHAGAPTALFAAAEEIHRDHAHHDLAVLIQRFDFRAHQAAVGLRLRTSRLEHRCAHAERVTGRTAAASAARRRPAMPARRRAPDNGRRARA
jgi:hypothetical protein